MEEQEREGRQERAGQGGRKEDSAGRRLEKLAQELRALERAGEMTVEIRAGAKRSEQKGMMAATRKLKAGRNYPDKWPGKKEGPVCNQETCRAIDHKIKTKSICHSAMTLKGGMECSPTINIAMLHLSKASRRH